MPRVTAYNEATHAALVAARRVGSSLKEACAAVGVNGRIVDDWLQRGRRWNEGDHTNPLDARYATFAQEMDSAHALWITSLRSRVTKATEKDGRLAWDVLCRHEEFALRREQKRLLRAKANVEEQRAAGLLVERHEVKHVAEMTEDELRAEAQRLLAAANGSGEHERAAG
jgi:hypothetical protein